jgi:hypothetical protein
VTCGNAGTGHRLASTRELPRLTLDRHGVWHVYGTRGSALRRGPPSRSRRLRVLHGFLVGSLLVRVRGGGLSAEWECWSVSTACQVELLDPGLQRRSAPGRAGLLMSRLNLRCSRDRCSITLTYGMPRTS